MHCLGFWHEHERNDRDDFIEVDWIASPGVYNSTCPIPLCTEFNKFPYVKGYKKIFPDQSWSDLLNNVFSELK